MRLGFVAASLATHLGVVGLAFLAFDAPVPPPPAAARESGLVSVELAALADMSVAAPVPPREASRGQSPASDDETQPPPPLETPAGKPVEVTRERPAERTDPPPTRQAARLSNTPPSTSVKRDVASATAEQTPTKSAEEDWLSMDQQLPEPAPEQKVAPQPKRDELVERLLAKEREKERIERRLESGRSRIAHAPTAVAATSIEMQPRAPEQSVGKSYESADAWVELTRWLPRAASSDREWERLSHDTRFDVQVRVRAVDTRIEVAAVGSVPEIVSRLLERTAHLMQSGRFAGPRPSERRFALRIRLSQTAERELWIAHTTPDPPKPGVGSYVSPTGRRFDVWVAADP